jgi:tRNA threonylcarbamoyl adenosine modification protein (Sua5/YciO/YrdC/YwlC family)
VRQLPFCEPGEVSSAIAPVAEAVASAGVVMVPTESYYGLAADPRSQSGVQRVNSLKDRPPDLGLPVLCADWQQLESLVAVPQKFRVKLARLWPAALTVVLPLLEPLAAARGSTLAVRIPAHRALRALLYRVGPLTGTSANRHGVPPSTTVFEALRSLTGSPDLVLDGGITAGGSASTIIDLTAAEARVLREGACGWEEPYPAG